MDKPMKRLKPELPREIVTSVPEHQILFSFNSDCDAETFYDWWLDEGEKAFLVWKEPPPEEF